MTGGVARRPSAFGLHAGGIMSTADEQARLVEAREKIAVAAGFALLIAATLLLTVVLPAEFDLDPFGWA